MNNDETFLRGILAEPGNVALWKQYADWLEQKGDPAPRISGMDPALDRLNYVAWLEKDGNLDYYLEKSPDVRREAEERAATGRLRDERRALGATLDPDWVAFINTLACPFEPFYFFSNHGSPRECEADVLPLAERIGTRGAIMTFESAFRDPRSWDPMLAHDLRFLSQLELGDCAYGAASCPLHPFVCELKGEGRPLTGAKVLASLHPRHFCSRYIRNLDATYIPYPGYRPGDGDGIENDEVHNDFADQHIFQKADDDEYDDEGVDVASETSGVHGLLKQSVVDGQLWYVLLHTTPQKHDRFLFSEYVILFAVGRSLHGNRLLGAVTHQVCHNLCD